VPSPIRYSGEIAATVKRPEDIDESLFSLAVNGDVDARVVPQNIVVVIGDVGTTEDNQSARITPLDFPDDLSGQLHVSDVTKHSKNFPIADFIGDAFDGTAPIRLSFALPITPNIISVGGRASPRAESSRKPMLRQAADPGLGPLTTAVLRL
jgi:hypothetical protein